MLYCFADRDDCDLYTILCRRRVKCSAGLRGYFRALAPGALNRPSIPSICVQRLLLGPKYNVATSFEEIDRAPNIYRGSKLYISISKRGGEGHPFLQYMSKGSSWVPYNVATSFEEIGRTNTYRKSKRAREEIKE